LGDLLSKLIREGVRVVQFRELQTDLEEAFLSFARPTTSQETGVLVAKGA
jgi:ABC-2 type transport system ATP-binding protein